MSHWHHLRAGSCLGQRQALPLKQPHPHSDQEGRQGASEASQFVLHPLPCQNQTKTTKMNILNSSSILNLKSTLLARHLGALYNNAPTFLSSTECPELTMSFPPSMELFFPSAWSALVQLIFVSGPYSPFKPHHKCTSS